MSLFNFATKELTLKIVYYGPGLSGKTTNLQYLHSVLNPDSRGKLLSLATEVDRTLFFDFLPVSLGKVKGFTVKIQLYTVPGQVYYNATRKLVLRGADAVVFVANSQKCMREENIESLKNMWDNLRANNLNCDEIPVVMQFNKRDLPDIETVDELNNYLNVKNYSFVEAIAIKGEGVEETFQIITKNLIKSINKKHKLERTPAQSLSSKSIFKGLKKEKESAHSGHDDNGRADSTVAAKKDSNAVQPVQKENIATSPCEEITGEQQKSDHCDLHLPDTDTESTTKQNSPSMLSLEDTEMLTEKLKIFSQKLASVDNTIENISTKLRQSQDEHKELLIMLDEINSLLHNDYYE
jgi:signal recognition particle receptor subunit beta